MKHNAKNTTRKRATKKIIGKSNNDYDAEDHSESKNRGGHYNSKTQKVTERKKKGKSYNNNTKEEDSVSGTEDDDSDEEGKYRKEKQSPKARSTTPRAMLKKRRGKFNCTKNDE